MRENNLALLPVESAENPVYYNSVRMRTPPHPAQESHPINPVPFPVLKFADLFAGIGCHSGHDMRSKATGEQNATI